jgi:hypothetical protein
MNQDMFKLCVCLFLMLFFLTIAFTTKNLYHDKLFASFSIIIGSYATYYLSNQKCDKL